MEVKHSHFFFFFPIFLPSFFFPSFFFHYFSSSSFFSFFFSHFFFTFHSFIPLPFFLSCTPRFKFLEFISGCVLSVYFYMCLLTWYQGSKWHWLQSRQTACTILFLKPSFIFVINSCQLYVKRGRLELFLERVQRTLDIFLYSLIMVK